MVVLTGQVVFSQLAPVWVEEGLRPEPAAKRRDPALFKLTTSVITQRPASLPIDFTATANVLVACWCCAMDWWQLIQGFPEYSVGLLMASSTLLSISVAPYAANAASLLNATAAGVQLTDFTKLMLYIFGQYAVHWWPPQDFRRLWQRLLTSRNSWKARKWKWFERALKCWTFSIFFFHCLCCQLAICALEELVALLYLSQVTYHCRNNTPTNSLQISSKVTRVYEDCFVLNVTTDCCSAGGWNGRLLRGTTFAAAGSFLLQNSLYLYTKKRMFSFQVRF